MTTPSNRVPDINGWYEVPRNPLSRVGVFPYSKKAVQYPGWETDPTGIVMVYRPESELAAPETLESFRLLPWTDGHAMLGDPDYQPGLTPAEQKGAHGVIGERIEYDPTTRTVYGNVKVWSSSLADAIEAGKKELSMGMRCVYEFVSGIFEGQNYSAIQTTLRGNHMASCHDGRMGPGVAVLDHMSFALDAKELSMILPAGKTTRRALFAKRLGLNDTDAARLLTGAAMDEAVDDAPPAEGDTKEPTLADLAAQIKALTPALGQIAEIQAALAKMAPSAAVAADTDPAPDGDMEPVLDANGAAVMDAAGKPTFKKKGGSAMDATEVTRRLTAAENVVADFQRNGVKALMGEIAKRDALANKVSDFVGVFDHSEMTLNDVATYAAGKLGLSPAKGTEIVAVESYLHGRTPERASNVFALDSVRDGGAKVPASVSSFLGGAKSA